MSKMVLRRDLICHELGLSSNQTYLKVSANFRSGKSKNYDSRKGAMSARFRLYPPFAKGDKGGISQFEKSPLAPLFQRGVSEALGVLARNNS
jgi:hypothetical protein